MSEKIAVLQRNDYDFLEMTWQTWKLYVYPQVLRIKLNEKVRLKLTNNVKYQIIKLS